VILLMMNRLTVAMSSGSRSVTVFPSRIHRSNSRLPATFNSLSDRELSSERIYSYPSGDLPRCSVSVCAVAVWKFSDAFALVLERYRTAKKLSRQALSEKEGL
jgi:hypothetical protein